LVESDGRKILIDPFLTGNPAAAAKAEDVPADFILISHGHGDHVGDAIAIASAPAPPSSLTTKSPAGCKNKV
jgi:L-ascorbate metabolism protein UlaG (beta-lactamase superfamily)